MLYSSIIRRRVRDILHYSLHYRCSYGRTKTFNMQFTLLVKFGIWRKYVIRQHKKKKRTDYGVTLQHN